MKLLRNLSDVGAAIREAREQRGVTLVDLAKLLGLSRSTLYRIETGSTSPTWGTVLGLCQVLDLQPALIPRDRVRAVEAVLQMTETADAPPAAGMEWHDGP